MEPRARAGKNRGQQNFSDAELNQFLFAHGDVITPLDPTKRVLDELLTDFITEICFEAQRGAQLAGRQKIKPDDIKFACRKNPSYLGKMDDNKSKKDMIDSYRKTMDTTDDKVSKSTLKNMEEPLGEHDDDADFEMNRSVKGKKGK